MATVIREQDELLEEIKLLQMENKQLREVPHGNSR